jgi:hypothetical protein
MSKKLVPDKKPPLIERTDTRGLVRVKIPWLAGHFEFEFPGTNRSVMIIICTMFCMLTFVLPACCYIIFVGADAENIERFGNMIMRQDHSDARKPEQVPVQTDDGIEIMELCPPCPDCVEDLEECPQCPVCPPQLPCLYPQSIPDSGV